VNARAIRAAHAATVSAEFTRDDVPGMGDKVVTFTAASTSIAYDDVRRRAYVEGYELEGVKVDGESPVFEKVGAILAKRIMANKAIDETINEKLDELANGFNG
jgi:hypothetical protein